jgi:hypothetical protein
VQLHQILNPLRLVLRALGDEDNVTQRQLPAHVMMLWDPSQFKGLYWHGKHVYIAKASEIDKSEINKWTLLTNFKGIDTFQMSYLYIQCNDVQIVKSTKGEINKHKYGLYLQWCLFVTGCPFPCLFLSLSQ